MKLQDLFKTTKDISYFYNKFKVLNELDIKPTYFASIRDIYKELDDINKIVSTTKC